MKSLRKLSDEICTKYDVVPLKPYTKTKEKRLSDGEYRMAMKGESWKFALMFTIDNAMKKAKTKQEFIDEMKKDSYEVLWTDERKYITYTCPNGMKCRDIKLHQEKYRKEKMELEFELRRVETEKCTAEGYSEREYAFGRKTDEQSVGETEEEMDSDILWNNDRSSSYISDSLYFAGNLFKLINNQTKYHRKRVKLSQKEIEKKLAHGQKSDGYEEYEDYYNNELTM